MSEAIHRQAGFTMIELLVASTAALILLLIVTGTILDAFRMANLLSARVTLNQQARVLHEILGLGGARDGINTTPATQNYTFGLHGRRSSGAAGTGWAAPSVFMAEDGSGNRLYRLALSPDDSSPQPAANGALLGPQTVSFEVACSGVSDPVVGCTVSGSVVMQGVLKIDPILVTDGRLRELSMQLFDPYAFHNRFGTEEDATLGFWMAFRLMVEEHPT